MMENNDSDIWKTCRRRRFKGEFAGNGNVR